MGNALCKIVEKLSSCTHKEVRILLLGLDAAGKTTILYKLKLGDYVKTVPTIGFNVETVEYKSISFTVWDVGGQEKIRHLWKHYLIGTQGLIFVLDSCDRERAQTAKQELQRLMDDPEVGNIKVLVLANKYDLPDAMPVEEAKETLGLSNAKRRTWHIQKCSAKTGEGLFEGLDWLAATLK